MRQFEDTPFGPDDYSDVALLVAAVREWPSEEFGRELDSRVARRFVPVASSADAKTPAGCPAGQPAPPLWSWRARLPRSWSYRAEAERLATKAERLSRLRRGIETVGREEKPTLATNHQRCGDLEQADPVEARDVALCTLARPDGSRVDHWVFATRSSSSGRQSDRARTRCARRQADPVRADQPEHPQRPRRPGLAGGLRRGAGRARHVQSSHITAATRGSGGGSAYFTLSFPTATCRPR